MPHGFSPLIASRMRQDLHTLLRQSKTTAILVAHDPGEAFVMTDRVAILQRGRLEQFDRPEAIYHLPASPFIAGFVGQADFITGGVTNDVITAEIEAFSNTQNFSTGSKVVVMIRPARYSYRAD